jgi:hypothetical protein
MRPKRDWIEDHPSDKGDEDVPNLDRVVPDYLRWVFS